MDYGGGDHQTADWGYVWPYGCRPQSVCKGLQPRLYAAVCSLWRYVNATLLAVVTKSKDAEQNTFNFM